MLSALLCLISVGIVLFFKEMITIKFQEIPMVYLLLMVQLVWFPVMMSTPFQIFCMKMERWNQLFLFSKIQLVVLVGGLFVLGHFFGIWGVISAIIIPEIVTFFLYKKEASKQNL
jgi:O-antigen/teichoic acid export membrane protein